MEQQSLLNTASTDNVRADSNNARKPDSRLNTIALTVMLVASVVLNIMLALKVRELTGAQNAARSERELKIGAEVPPIMAKRLDGVSGAITYADSNRPTVLYIFTPQCGWCTRNLDNLKTLINRKSEEYRFIGISLSGEDLEKYLVEHQLKFPVYTDIPKEAGEAYRMGGTPHTIVISPQGQVLQNWVGAYAGDQKSQVEAYFNVILPGIQPDS